MKCFACLVREKPLSLFRARLLSPMLFFSLRDIKCSALWNHRNTRKDSVHVSRRNVGASSDETADVAKLWWQHFDFKDGQLINAPWQNTLKRCLKRSAFLFSSCRDSDKNCQDCSASTLLTAACVTKPEPPLPQHKRSSLFAFPPPLSLYFLFLDFSACLSSSLGPARLVTPNQIYLHYFTSPCWNSYIWYIFNSISSGNVPLPDKSNHGNLETKKNAPGP